MLGRLARDAPAFLGTPVDLARAGQVLRQQLSDREGRFLGVVRETVYGHPRSPYRALLREAGCTFEDLRALVSREGLEAAVSSWGSRAPRASALGPGAGPGGPAPPG